MRVAIDFDPAIDAAEEVFGVVARAFGLDAAMVQIGAEASPRPAEGATGGSGLDAGDGGPAAPGAPTAG